MTRDGKGGLSHHEELRYFYLLRHLTLLTENEKREYRYLKAKMDSQQNTSWAGQTSHQFEHSSQNNSLQTNDYHQESTSLEDYPNSQANESYTGGLPLYPVSEKPKRSGGYSRKNRHSSAHARQEVIADSSQGAGFYQPENDWQPVSPKKPKKSKKKAFKKAFKVLLVLLTLCVIGAVGMFIKGYFDVSTNTKNYKPAVSEPFNGVDTKNGTNILVLGSDKRVTQTSEDARTDTIMVVNIGNKDKKVKMVSFMRDTLVNIPNYSYNDYSYDLKLNASFSLGEQENHHGAEFVRKVLKHNFDIDIKYYVMVDFETFAEAIDTLFPNGVKIDAKFATIDGEAVDSVDVPDDLRMKDGVVPDQTIKVGEQQMDGRTLLNYARFRKDDQGDYGRTVRQQQVMAAVMSQIKDPTKLFTGSAAIGKIYALTSTNLSFPVVLQKGLSTMTGGKGVEHVTIPENGDWVDEYDMYGGQALYIDFAKYQKSLAKMGLR
ncbi:LCP family protein [Streptococcus uberis]|nr:LCP family protein [Streptococcus uberis]